VRIGEKGVELSKKSKRVNRANRRQDGGWSNDDAVAIINSLEALDEKLSVTMGPDWVYRDGIEPDIDGPWLVRGGGPDEIILGPKARAVVLRNRHINELIIEAGREALAAEAGAL
jgi:hypothetical protein